MTRTSPRTTVADAEAGLTLVEILVVIAIMGMALTLGSTSWLQWRTARILPDSAAKIAAVFKEARVEALATGKVVTVQIDVQGRRFETPSIGRSLVLPQEIHLSVEAAKLGAGTSVRMLPDGSSTGANISLTREDQQPLELSVSWIDGTLRDAE